MNQEFVAVLDYMEKEKGIKREVMLEAVQAALLTAARKAVGPARELSIQIDPKSGKIRAMAKLVVAEKVVSGHDEIGVHKAREITPGAKIGDEVDVEVTPKDFGRIAAQVFKQTINQNIRNIERGMIFTEFKDRAGAIVSGTVRRFEKMDVIVDLGKFEAKMTAKERVPTENYAIGDRIRAYVVSVENTPRGPEIVLSRSHPNFVKKLFELEVSELNDKTIIIKSIAREPGFRTKMAVWSDNEKIDPVGACVGIRGSRVKNIVRELNNEKIDLFKWSPNIKELVIEALKPAKLKAIEVDEKIHHVRVSVDEENLSLAIGKRGQNARLASRLVGWEIDVLREEVKANETFDEKLHKASDLLATQLNISSEQAAHLVRAGFLTADAIAEVEETDLREALPDIPADILPAIREAALKLTQTVNA